MIEEKRFNQYVIDDMDDVRGITIHNTNNRKSARENAEIMENTRLNISTHFFVDENEVIQMIPTNKAVAHTGKAYDFGNLHTIAIEICRSQSDLESYIQAESNAIVLIKELMNKYNLKSRNIYFHNDFDKTKFCPHRILQFYGNKTNFIKERGL